MKYIRKHHSQFYNTYSVKDWGKLNPLIWSRKTTFLETVNNKTIFTLFPISSCFSFHLFSIMRKNKKHTPLIKNRMISIINDQ